MAGKVAVDLQSILYRFCGFSTYSLSVFRKEEEQFENCAVSMRSLTFLKHGDALRPGSRGGYGSFDL